MISTLRCRRTWLLLFSAFLVALLVSGGTMLMAGASNKVEPMIFHNVFFSTKDKQAAQELIAGCKKYLAGEPGTIVFSAGTLSDFDRDVNDRNFDVGLHLVFKDRASHDKYQTSANHTEFIEKCKHTWTKVRVFDTDVDDVKPKTTARS